MPYWVKAVANYILITLTVCSALLFFYFSFIDYNEGLKKYSVVVMFVFTIICVFAPQVDSEEH